MYCITAKDQKREKDNSRTDWRKGGRGRGGGGGGRAGRVSELEYRGVSEMCWFDVDNDEKDDGQRDRVWMGE